MIPRMLRQFTKLEAAKIAVLADLQQWPEGSLGQHPESGGWSALEVIEHVMLTERSILGAMRKNIVSPRHIQMKDWLRNGMVMCVMLLPARVKIPAGARQVTPTGQTADLINMTIGWDAVRRDLAEFLESVRESNLSGGVVRHPVGGWTTIEGALWFVRAHLRHHRYQLSRIRARFRAKKRARGSADTAN